MKKIAYCLLIGLSFTLLCSCFSDKDELYFMRDIDMFIRLYQKAGTDTAYIFFDNKEDVDSSNLIKISPIYELPSAKIIINKSDSIIYLYRIYSDINEINIRDFQIIKIDYDDNNLNLYRDNLRGLFWDNDSIVFTNLNQGKKKIAVFEIWPYAETIEKWYTTPGWHKMESYYSY